MGRRRPTTRRRSGIPALAVVATVALLGGCSSSEEHAGEPAASTPTERRPGTEPAGTGHCDDTDPTACLLPWPSDAYTRTDPTTATGRRLDLPVEGMPANAAGTPIDPAEWNRNDGFSPASIGLVVVADVDPDTSELPPVTDIGASTDPGSNLALVDVDTGERLPAWAELDVEPADDPGRRPLRVVPAVALPEGHRIAVGLWHLRTTAGAEVDPGEELASTIDTPDDRQRQWLDALEAVGGPLDELDAAWSFTVASAGSLSGRLRSMWSETLDELADRTPAFTITSSEQTGATRIVEGSLDMPRYLTGDGGPGTVLDNEGDPDGIPERNGTMGHRFTCVLPAEPAEPSPVVLYGHGLLGTRAEVLGIGALGASVGIAFCATDFIGMSVEDAGAVLDSLGDLTRFRTVPDRLQQGHLGLLLLGHLLADPEGLGTHEAFQRADGTPAINGQALSYLGASQGAILGGPATALSPDWDRAVLAVGGLGYNLMLPRSIDFDEFAGPFAAAYPDPLDRALAMELMEELWQRGENAGWVEHLTGAPFEEGGGPTTVLLLEAFGDHQVANVATEKLARTLAVPRVAPTLAEGRSTDREPFHGIPPLDTLPHAGDALVVWDFGTPPPPTANTPPREGSDPHGKLGEVPQALAMVAAFVQPNGVVLDMCGGQPCTSPG